MKQRIISSVIGLAILSVVLFFFDTWVFNAAIACIVAVAVYEFLAAVGCAKNKPLTLLACIYAGGIPFIPHWAAVRIFPPVTLLYIAALMLLLLACHTEISALQIAFAFFISITIPFSLTVSIYLRDKQGAPTALFLILMALSVAWTSDSGAYFVGRKFGKHQLSPQISPKKTVEGAVGGVVVCTAATLLIAALFQAAAPQMLGVGVSVNYLALGLCCPALSVAGMLGDLTASVIKRQNHIKDYGHIMPGHGGVVDRFDSVFFTAPLMFMLSFYIPFIRVL